MSSATTGLKTSAGSLVDFRVGLVQEDSYKEAMMRLAIAVLVLSLAGCGGGQSEAKHPKTEQLTAGEKCIREANVKQVPPTDTPQRIDVAYIVVKHDQVKGAIKQNIIRTREEACLRAVKARQFLLSSNDWDAGYKKYSDGGGATEGVLSGIAQGDVDTSFSNAAFSLKVDELSHVVESPKGFLIILRKQ
jgi:NIMA-interacting peptidyl-prolyl cis-trans isomerase 1